MASFWILLAVAAIYAQFNVVTTEKSVLELFPTFKEVKDKLDQVEMKMEQLVDAKQECRKTISGVEYKGKKSVTRKGKTCQRWDRQYPHKHSQSFTKEDENYCRNPNNNAHGIWCYTTDPNLQWDYCDVPMCPTEPSVVYTRWGRTSCPSHAALVYSGFAGGSYYNHPGAAVEPVCLPKDPQWGKYDERKNTCRQFMMAAEYQLEETNAYNKNNHNWDVPCAVCRSVQKSSLIVIPARKDCYNGWTKEYSGYLMSGGYQWKAGTSFSCMDETLEKVPGTGSNTDGYLFYHVETLCDYMKGQCPPYKGLRELTCVVCSI